MVFKTKNSTHLKLSNLLLLLSLNRDFFILWLISLIFGEIIFPPSFLKIQKYLDMILSGFFPSLGFPISKCQFFSLKITLKKKG
jgi:hypothetical protein